MANYTVINNNFVSGEISPMMDGRIDSPKYLTGLAVCENFIPSSQGPLIKRAGTKYIGKLASSVDSARLALFEAGVNGRFIVEFTDLLIRFWTEDGDLVQSGESPLTIVSTYTESEISDLSCVMNKGVMYIVHPDHQPAKITLSAGPSFTLTTITFTGGRTFDSAGSYPSCQAFKGGRWYLAATDDEPNAIFASRTTDTATGDRFTDFTFQDEDGTVLPSHAIYLQETDMYGSKINWLINQKRILAGAGSSIWMDSGEIATPATFDMAITLSGGANKTEARAVGSYIIYAGPGGKTLNAMHYNSESDGYLNDEISQSASHMLDSGVKDFVISRMRETIIWVLNEDGTLCSCTFNATLGVIGWARHPLGKGSDGLDMTVQSIELLPGDDTKEDVVWMTVLRAGSIYIETMTIYSQDISNDTVYLDCHASQALSPALATVTFTYLAGETVSAIADGALLPPKTLDSSGNVTYDRAVEDISVGFQITAKIRLLRPELPSNGTSQGKKRQVQKQVIRRYNSLGGRVGLEDDSSMTELLPLVSGEYVYGSSYDLFTGDYEVNLTSFIDNDGRIFIISDEPFPFNLLAVMTTFGITEG
ncbi:MAG: hypothetical protein JXK93_13485 [Sphaerochaetaceae bacterium]|nr:hypothetical protein [Sphaerochaetaceae bacterium]